MEKKLSLLLLVGCLFSPIALTLTSCFPKAQENGAKKEEARPVNIEEEEEDATPAKSCTSCQAAPQKKAPVAQASFRSGSFGKTRTIKSEADLADALQYGNVVVDFWAPWCGPCKALSPIIDELAAAFPHVLFVKVNFDENEGLVQRYGIQSIPTVLYIKNGQIKKEVGFKGKAAVRDLVQRTFGK